MKNLTIRKTLLRTMIAGTIALQTLTGCSIKSTQKAPFSVVIIDDSHEEDLNSEELTDIVYTLPTRFDYSTAYKAVDGIKDIISNNKIGTVFIDIGIDLYPMGENKEEYKKYIKKIAEKLEANGVNFVLMGSADQLDSFKEYKSMVTCDKKANIKELLKNHDFVIFKDTIYSKDKYKSKESSPESFVEDEVYIVQPGDSLYVIAEKYGVDYEELGKFNDIEDFKVIYKDQKIRIPSEYQTDEIEKAENTATEATEEGANENEADVDIEKPEEENASNESTPEQTENVASETEEEIQEAEADAKEASGEGADEEETKYVEVDETKYYKGIDVSEHQGEIDWEKAKKADFAFLRIADAINRDEEGNILIDEYFERNIKECLSKDIKIGIYIFSRAETEEEIQEEINFVLENLKDENGEYYPIPLPIYLDVEEECADNLLKDEDTRRNQVKLMQIFCQAMEDEGFATGVYINGKYLDKIDEIKGIYSIWGHGENIGGYLYHKYTDFDHMYYGYKTVDEYFTTTYNINVIQTTSYGIGEDLGIDGRVDFDYADKEFFDALYRLFEEKQAKKQESKGAALTLSGPKYI